MRYTSRGYLRNPRVCPLVSIAAGVEGDRRTALRNMQKALCANNAFCVMF
jgi:hypothetical protein